MQLNCIKLRYLQEYEAKSVCASFQYKLMRRKMKVWDIPSSHLKTKNRKDKYVFDSHFTYSFNCASFILHL